VLRVDHPDILDFIDAKRNETAFRNFNLSVAVTDTFMEAVRRQDSLDLINPRTRRKSGSLNATQVFDAVTRAAWETGDPGLIFFDAVQRANPTPHVGMLEATNPCGEIPLLPFESCNLGSINLGHMLRDGGDKPGVDWQKLGDAVRLAVRFLDDVIEVNRYPVPEIKRMARGNRKIGLGLMGFSDMLIRLGIPYDSDGALHLAQKIMEVVASEAYGASRRLAAERGVFGNWEGSTHHAQGLALRNATCTTIAPTGTISIIAGTSPSIEPLFALAYRRSHVLGDQTLFELNPMLGEQAARLGLDREDIADQVRAKGHLRDVPQVPEDLKRLFVTALEIPFRRHLEIQAAFQRHVDNSVSKTINMPEEATVDDVKEAYRTAWELGLKGITIYRYGSKSQQVLELGADEESYHYDHSSKCDPEECRV
jgi:ribonucleoside-diphosphate reductase alpha chain